jgi:hypothetical protein
MATALSKLPYNRGEAADGHDLIAKLG